jgi:hypothetical protein
MVRLSHVLPTDDTVHGHGLLRHLDANLLVDTCALSGAAMYSKPSRVGSDPLRI